MCLFVCAHVCPYLSTILGNTRCVICTIDWQFSSTMFRWRWVTNRKTWNKICCHYYYKFFHLQGHYGGILDTQDRDQHCWLHIVSGMWVQITECQTWFLTKYSHIKVWYLSLYVSIHWLTISEVNRNHTYLTIVLVTCKKKYTQHSDRHICTYNAELQTNTKSSRIVAATAFSFVSDRLKMATLSPWRASWVRGERS